MYVYVYIYISMYVCMYIYMMHAELFNYTLCLHAYMAYGCGSSTFMNDAIDDDSPVFVCDLHAFSGHEAAPLSCRNQIFEDLRSQSSFKHRCGHWLGWLGSWSTKNVQHRWHRSKVWGKRCLMHLLPEDQCSLPLSFCCERVNSWCISDNCRGDAAIHHVAEQTQGWLPLPCSSTTADGGVVADDVWRPTADLQLLEKMQRQLPQSTTFFQRTDDSTVGHEIGPKLCLWNAVEDFQGLKLSSRQRVEQHPWF